MQFSFLNTPIVDCHIHYPHPDLMPGLMEILNQHNIQQFNIVCTPHRTRLSLVPEALMLKAQSSGRAYVFGGLDISAFFMQPQTSGQYFADYVEKLAAMGCDGIKMIEGKPDMRRMMPIPNFDDPVYDPYWKKMETHGIPAHLPRE